jgi:hypothetical protein
MASAAIGNPRPAQVAAFFDRNDHRSPGRRPHSIHRNVTIPASTRRRSKTRRDPLWTAEASFNIIPDIDNLAKQTSELEELQ